MGNLGGLGVQEGLLGTGCTMEDRTVGPERVATHIVGVSGVALGSVAGCRRSSGSRCCCCSKRQTETDRDRQAETDRQTERQKQAERQTETGRERERDSKFYFTRFVLYV